MMLRSAKTTLSRIQIHRHGFPLETGLARQFIAPAASAVGKSPSELNSPVPNPAAIARSEVSLSLSLARVCDIYQRNLDCFQMSDIHLRNPFFYIFTVTEFISLVSKASIIYAFLI